MLVGFNDLQPAPSQGTWLQFETALGWIATRDFASRAQAKQINGLRTQLCRQGIKYQALASNTLTLR
eukprot:scaffold57400_cov19-Prasinocladus_malaysianus.AAC.1